MASDSGPEEPDSAPPAGAHGNGLVLGGALGRLTRSLALVGGGLLLIAVAITIVSVVGRYAFAKPVPGDYELIEIICAIAIFLFFPYTHATDSNISAKFFTSGLSQRHQRILDVSNDVIFALIAALLTWRLAHGLENKLSTGETTILVRVPIWWAYVVAVLSMALLTVVCVFRVAIGIGTLRR
jgi:TRAP-type C4-dicarboxylate transport system permease small subunit